MTEQPETKPPFFLLGAKLQSANTHQIDLDSEFIVRDLLPVGQVGLLVGPTNIGKSAVLGTICSHVAMGKSFCGYEVRRSAILYIAAEDSKGVLDRAYPYMSTAPADTAMFMVHKRAIDLMDEEEVEKLRQGLLDFMVFAECERLLCVIDTMNLCVVNGEENSSRDMSKVLRAARSIVDDANIHLLIVHHTSLGTTDRPRGSSALESNADVMLVLKRAENTGDKRIVYLTSGKLRNAVKEEHSMSFTIEKFTAGYDKSQREITVPKAKPMEGRVRPEAITPDNRSTAPADARTTEILRVLRELADRDPNGFHLPPDIAARAGDLFAAVRPNPDSMRKAVRRALDALIGAGKAETDGSGRYRAAQSAAPHLH